MQRLIRRTLCCAGLLGLVCTSLCPRASTAQTAASLRAATPGFAPASARTLPVIKKRSRSQGTVRAASTQSSRIVSLSWPVGRLHSLGLTTEYFKTSTHFVSAYGIGDKPDWKYKSIPVTVSYEFTVPTDGRLPVEPYVGVGASVHFSQARTLEVNASYVEGRRVFDLQRGMGLGGEAIAGFRYRMPGATYLLAQGRYRLVDGFMIGAADRGSGRFAQFDLAVGFGVSF